MYPSRRTPLVTRWFLTCVALALLCGVGSAQDAGANAKPPTLFLIGDSTVRNGAGDGGYDLAGPELLSYDDIVRIALRASHRRRRLLHVPLPVVRGSLRALRRLAGPKVFATWEEAELMEEPMTTERGTADIETLGVSPRPMSAVLP